MIIVLTRILIVLIILLIGFRFGVELIFGIFIQVCRSRSRSILREVPPHSKGTTASGRIFRIVISIAPGLVASGGMGPIVLPVGGSEELST